MVTPGARHALLLLLQLAIAILGRSSASAQTFYATVIGNPDFLVGSSTLHSGLYRSSDAGLTWEHLGPRNLKAYAMDAVDSSRGRILFIAAGNGIHKSTDYGRTWKIMTDWRITEVLDVKVDQHHPQQIHAATASGLWRSDDGGQTWQNPDGMLKERYVYRIDTIHADGEMTACGEDAVYVSFDRGISWSLQLETRSPRGMFTIGNYGTVLASSKGPIWYPSNEISSPSDRPGASSPDMNVYDVVYRNDTIFTATDKGIWFLGIATRSVAWRKLNFDIPNYAAHAIAATPQVLLVGTFGNGVFRLENNSWKPSGLDGAQVWNLVVKQW